MRFEAAITVFTARKRSLGQGNIFAPVCHSVHGGGKYLERYPAPQAGTPPGRYTPGRYAPSRYTPLGRYTPSLGRYTPPDRYPHPLAGTPSPSNAFWQGSHSDWKGRVPTRTGKPGKIGRHFPVREKSGSFEQTGKSQGKSNKILEN